MPEKERSVCQKNMNARSVGSEKERRAAGFLQQRGMVILARNFRCRFGEIDLIAREGSVIVFVEVKYRRNRKAGYPEEAVSEQKMRRISRIADFYRVRYQIPDAVPFRFDVIAIEGPYLRHYTDAFPYIPLR